VQPDSDQWARFAAAALTGLRTGNNRVHPQAITEVAAQDADALMKQWKERYPRVRKEQQK
jgi:hypothetical protein